MIGALGGEGSPVVPPWSPYEESNERGEIVRSFTPHEELLFDDHASTTRLARGSSGL